MAFLKVGGWAYALVLVLSLAVSVTAGRLCGNCNVNTTLAFIVDTSYSTDAVASSMIQALDAVASKNGVVLSFADYQLATWAFLPDDVQHFATIQELEVFFKAHGINNVRIDNTPPPKHDDWAYMLSSLYVAVNNASPNGFVVILGDEDELCDGRPWIHDSDPVIANAGNWYGGNYDNKPYNDLIPSIISIATSKNVRISFYYFLTQLDPDVITMYGCLADPTRQFNRQWVVDKVNLIASSTGGTVVFNTSVADSMATEVKQQGKQASVCPCCTDHPTLGFVIDTSGSIVRVKKQVTDLFSRLLTAFNAGFLAPFEKYLVATWATTNVTVTPYDTFTDLYWAVQQDAFYADMLFMNASHVPSVDGDNDWAALSQNLKALVTQMGYGGYMVVITDEDAFCDAGEYSQNIWTQELQEVISVAVAKQVSLSWYMFEELPSEGANIYDMCSTIPDVQQIYRGALGRAGAMATILAGDSILGIALPQSTAYTDALDAMSALIVVKSQLGSCSNCTVNATLGFLVDTSQSANPIKVDLKWTFAQIGGMATQLAGFPGGFVLNTYQQTYDTELKFATVGALSSWVVAAGLDANRVGFDAPSHNHDDWRYMLEGLKPLIKAVGRDGNVVIIGDDNQICDALLWSHNSSEPLFVQAVALAKQYDVTLSYVQLATPTHWCTHAEMWNGQSLAETLVTLTGGFKYFGSNESLVREDVTAHLLPELAKAGARPVCAQQCGQGYVWAVDHCMLINPCDVKPCLNGATCHPTLYSTTFSCECATGYWGARCQYPCVPHSFDNQTNHALGIVLDTSDSTAFAINSMKAALAQITSNASHEFDAYFISTWAYLTPLVHHFGDAAAVVSELNLTTAGNNKRTTNDSGLATHNDWKYMLDSVEAMLPIMGTNGVMLVVTDFEGVCDASKDARLVNGVPRYPMNPDPVRIAALNALAKTQNIKIIFVTFPSSDYGWCNATQKAEGLTQAWALVKDTQGTVEEMPAYLSTANTQLVSNELAMAVAGQAAAERCACPFAYAFDAQYNMCHIECAPRFHWSLTANACVPN